MSNYNIQSFCVDLMAQPNNSPWFWNMVDLARGNLAHYTGPRNENDFFEIVRQKYRSENTKRLNHISLQIYENINNIYTQSALRWVFVLSPLIILPEQYSSVFSGTTLSELDCYNILLTELYKFSDPKLKYDILTKIIRNIEHRYNLLNPDIFAIYHVAKSFRANCDFACLSQDTKIQDTRIQDLYLCMLSTNIATTKLNLAKQIINVLMARLEKCIKTNNKPESEIKNICRDAYKYVAGASAANQDFVDWVWDTFDYHKIINIPKLCANYKAR